MNDETTTTNTEEALHAGAVRSGLLSRRRLLVGGAASVALFAAACGDDDDDEEGADGGDGSTTTTVAGGGASAADIQVGTIAAQLEVLAVGTYQAGLDAAGAGALGEVPPAVATYATTALMHHQEALDAWNGGLSLAGAPTVTEPNPELKATVDAMFAEVTDVPGLANLALTLEKIAAHTYLAALPLLSTPEAIRLAGSIQAVDQQHQAILLFAIGQYPVPEVFQSTDQAVTA